MNRLRLWVIFAVVLGATVGCDRATKHVAVDSLKGEPTQSFLGDSFRLGYAENPGAFLGMGGNLPGSAQYWIFTVGVGVLLLGMVVWMALSRSLDLRTGMGLSMIVGGGFSNWIDRVLNDGRVVDFLNLGIGSLRTGIFNVADVAIMAGAVLIAFSGAKKSDSSTQQAQPG